MKWSLHGAAIFWPKGKEKEYTIRMNLHLSVEDFLDSTNTQNISREIAQVESGIRRRLKNVFACEVVPHLLELSKQDARVPQEVGVGCSNRWENTPFIDDSDLVRRGLVVHNQLRLLFNITTNTPLTSVQATYLVRANIASTLASVVMTELKHKYLDRN